MAHATPAADPTADPNQAVDACFFELSTDLLCVLGLDGRIVRANAAWQRVLGLDGDELVGRAFADLVHPDHRSRLDVTSDASSAVFDVRMPCKGTSERWIAWTKRSVPGASVMLAIGRDITHDKVAEAQLHGKSAELEAVFKALPDLLFRTDAEGRIVDYSAGRASDLYAPPETFLGKSFGDVLPTEVARILVEAMVRARQSGGVEALEYDLLVPSGPQRFEARVVPFRGGHSITVVRNVTERWLAQEALRRSEERLRESEKLEAVGRLAGGVAHDINNLMMVVSMYSDRLFRALEDADPNRKSVLEIRKAGERATRLSRQLLSFAKRQLLSPVLLNPGTIVREMEEMLRDALGDGIALVCDVDPELHNVLADRSQLEQVVLNLALNARDAMPSGGHLEIVLANEAIDEERANRLELPIDGAYVSLRVTDTGSGIDPAARPHIFEPFFTTKEAGAGSGLGLATVYGVVRQSGGAVTVQTALGEGSSFTILLPRADEGDGTISVPPPKAEPATRPRTVLIVEDEAPLRRALRDAVESLGYDVLEAEDGFAALAISQSHQGEIDVLLTDMVMPGMRGDDLARRFVEARPQTRLVFMSGYSEPGTHWPTATTLQKPFSPDQLARSLREADGEAG